MTETLNDIKSYAMTLVLKLSEAFSDYPKKDEAGRPIVDSIVRRANELPALVLQVGLVPAATFYMGKLTKSEYVSVYIGLYKYLVGAEGGSDKSVSKLDKGKLNSVVKEDAGGYPVLLAVLAAILGKYGSTYTSVKECSNDLGNLVQLAKCLRNLLKANNAAFESLVVEGLVTVKRLVNALFAKSSQRK